MSLKVLNGKFSRIHLWADLAQVESVALDQLKNIAGLPWVRRISVMPDVHLGKGATVGSVIGMKNALSPSAVGVDIGCGMGAIRTNMTANELADVDLPALRSAIEEAIPVGFSSHERSYNDVFEVQGQIPRLFGEFKNLSEHVQDLEGRARLQLGTLGGGNHFIELCLDTEDRVWLMLHSGSRNIGKSIAEVHINVAKKLDHNQLIEDRELSVFLANTPEFIAYENDLMWAQRYAYLNRMVMFRLYKNIVQSYFSRADPLGQDIGSRVVFDEPILCHHNYVARETHFGEELIVTRKGAIRAQKGDLGVIPGSMGTKSYIVEGLGNEESLTSASHGAGRRMSRGKAKERFTLADLAEQTAGVECRKDEAVLDEIPGAYKDIDQVMEHQKDLVKIKHELKAVLCVKG